MESPLSDALAKAEEESTRLSGTQSRRTDGPERSTGSALHTSRAGTSSTDPGRALTDLGMLRRRFES